MDSLAQITWILAPMDGITDCYYRNAWMDVFGSYSRMHEAVSPFVSLVRGATVKPSHLRDLWPQNNKMTVEPQILGNEIEFFPVMAAALQDLGYTSVNWNLGCPMKRVAQKKRGSGLLPYPEMIDDFLEHAFSATSLDISVKIRLGYRSKEEIYPIVRVLNRYPLRYVALHPRIGTQLYSGEVDWEAEAEVCSLLHHPVVHSGQINSVQAAQDFVSRFPGIDRIMIGRGVIANPFLPCRLCGDDFTAEHKRRMFATFVELLLENYMESPYERPTVLQRQKMFWSRFAGDFVPFGAFDIIKRIDSLERYRQFCKDLFV